MTIGSLSVCQHGSSMVPWLDSIDFDYWPEPQLAGIPFLAHTYENKHLVNTVHGVRNWYCINTRGAKKLTSPSAKQTRLCEMERVRETPRVKTGLHNVSNSKKAYGLPALDPRDNVSLRDLHSMVTNTSTVRRCFWTK